MAKLRGKEIQALAKEIIRTSPGGIRYSKLLERILSLHPETPNNTIQGAIWDLDKTFSGEVFKPSVGCSVWTAKQCRIPNRSQPSLLRRYVNKISMSHSLNG